MSVKITDNTTSLNEVLAAVNALPDAGSGGGGGIQIVTGTLEAQNFTMSPEETVLYEVDLGFKPKFVQVYPSANVTLSTANRNYVVSLSKWQDVNIFSYGKKTSSGSSAVYTTKNSGTDIYIELTENGFNVMAIGIAGTFSASEYVAIA